MEKTRHYLLLREKLEASVLLSQESLCSKDLMESPKSPSPNLAGSPILDGTNERQRELAAKVITFSLHIICLFTLIDKFDVIWPN